MPVEDFAHAQVRAIIKGKLATGEHIEAHETTLPPNESPHPPHRHLHSEMWLIREGTVELTIKGASHRLGPGGVGFVHSNEEHVIKNVGTVSAIYYVVAIGPGAEIPESTFEGSASEPVRDGPSLSSCRRIVSGLRGLVRQSRLTD